MTRFRSKSWRIDGHVDLPFPFVDVYNVYRDIVKRTNMGLVEQIEFTEQSKRILFHFSRANISEWHDFDTEKIRPYKPRGEKDSSVGFSLKTARCPTTVDADNIEVGGK